MNVRTQLTALLTAVCLSFICSAQDVQSAEWRTNRIIFLESALHHLNVPREELRFEVIPALEAKRSELAPHFPALNGVFGEEREDQIEAWVIAYPLEWTAYHTYFETFIRSYK